MVDHFHDHVLAPGKIGGKARAMVICNGIERAIQYFHAFKTYLAERKSPAMPLPCQSSATTFPPPRSL